MANDATIIIGADVSQATKGIDKLNRSLSLIKLDALTNLAGKAMDVGKNFISSTSGIQKLQSSLKVVTGSAENATAAFDKINTFAQQTQFTVSDLSQAYIKLKAAGIEPTNQMLQTFADTAAITTDSLGSLEAMTDLITRTTAGGLGLEELQRLADRGIPVFRILQEEMGLTRDAVTDFGKSAEGANEIVNVLMNTMGDEFAGAAKDMADTAETAFQNLGSEWDQLLTAVMQGGLDDMLKGAAEFATKWVKIMKGMIPYVKIELVRLEGFFKYSWQKIQYGLVQGVNYIKLAFAKMFDFVMSGWNGLARGAIQATNKMIEAVNFFGSDFELIKEDFLTVESMSDSIAQDIDTARQYHEAETKAILDKTNARIGDMQTAMAEAEVAKQVAAEKAMAADALAAGGPMVPGAKATGPTYSQEGADATGPLEAYTEYYDSLREKLSVHINAEQDMLEQSYGWKLKKLEELKRASIISQEQLEAAKENITQEGVKTSISSLGEGLNALGQHNEKAFKMAKAFNIAQAVMQTYQSATAAFASLAPIPFIGPALGAVAAAGAIASGMAQVASIRSQQFQGRMYGGSVTGNQTYMVGERGPELFTPGRTGTITPNDDIGGKEVNVNFSIQAVDQRGISEMLTAQKPQIVGMIKQAVNEQPGLLG